MNAKMPELKKSFEVAGFTEVKTLLSSGNVVFSARATSEAALERKAEKAMTATLGRMFLTIVRPVEALQELLESEPYGSFRLAPQSAKGKLTLPIALDGARILRAEGREVFSAYVPSPRGPAFMALIEKTFGKDVTTRTWETVAKVAR